MRSYTMGLETRKIRISLFGRNPTEVFFEMILTPIPICFMFELVELSPVSFRPSNRPGGRAKMSDGYDLEYQDEVVAAPVPEVSQPAPDANWTLTDLRQGSSRWSLASDSGVRITQLYLSALMWFHDNSSWEAPSSVKLVKWIICWFFQFCGLPRCHNS